MCAMQTLSDTIQRKYVIYFKKNFVLLKLIRNTLYTCTYRINVFVCSHLSSLSNIHTHTHTHRHSDAQADNIICVCLTEGQYIFNKNMSPGYPCIWSFFSFICLYCPYRWMFWYQFFFKLTKQKCAAGLLAWLQNL